MRRSLEKLLMSIVLILLVSVPVYADCEVEHLSVDDVDYEIKGISDTPYKPGEEMKLAYYIYPSNPRAELDGDCGASRYYDVYTTLEESKITATIDYESGREETRPIDSDVYEQFGNGKHLCFAVPDSSGVEEIEVELIGTLPSVYSNNLTVLSLDMSHADRGILPSIKLVGSENPTEAVEENTPSQTPISEQQLSSPEIENLSLSIEPAYVDAEPGDTVNYTVIVNWSPSDWRGDLRFCGTLSAAGFQKSFDFQPVRPSKSPPIENEVPVTLPESIPPFDYTVNLTVNAGPQKANDETELKVTSSTTTVTPGFESAVAITGLFAGLYLVRRRRQG